MKFQLLKMNTKVFEYWMLFCEYVYIISTN